MSLRGSFRRWSLLIASLPLLIAVFGVLAPRSAQAAQTIPYKVNFQGRLTDNSGNILADGYYNIKFRIYDASTAGTNKYEEDRVYAGTGAGPAPGANDNRVQITNGLFNIQFGDVTTLSPGLFSGGYPLYLEVELPTPATATCATVGCATWTELPMTPRQPLAASPYAFNSDTLDGLDSSAFAQLSAANTYTAANLFAPTAASTVGLVVKGTSSATTGHVLDLYNAGASQSLQDYFDAAGSLNVAQVIQPTSNNAVDLGIATVAFRNVYAANFDTGSVTTALTIGTSNAASIQIGKTGVAANLPGGLVIGSGQSITVGATAGATVAACAANQYISGQAVSGGVVTGGSCLGLPGAGTITLQNAYDNATSPATITETASKGMVITSGTTVSATDMLTIDNTGSTGAATAGSDGIDLKYKGGAAAVAAEGMRIDFTPGTTSGGTWSGLRFAPTAAAAAGVTQYGVMIDNIPAAGGGADEGLYVGTNWDIGLDVQSGGLQLAAQSDPTTPTGSNLRVYAKNIAGRIMPKWLAPSGVDTPFQSSFGFNRIAMMAPSGNGTTNTTIMTNWGSNFTNSASVYSDPTLASTNLNTSVRRARMQTSTASTTAIAYHIPTALQVWRGNAAGLGGFFFTTRFSFATLIASNRAFIGMVDSTAAPTSVDPTTSTTIGKLGIAINSNTGNLKWINNVAGTAPTVTDLGTSYPLNATDLYELIIFSPPNGSNITYRVQDISTGAVTANTSVSTNIPAATTFLAPQYWIADGGTTGGAAIDNAGWYLESDN